MSGTLRRLLTGATLAALLAGAMPAASVLAWNLYCNDTHRICIYKHEADPPTWPTPRATKDETVNSYVTEGNYPNTSEPVNDSLTAARNLFASSDVRFYEHINQSTLLFCLPESSSIANVGSADNDKASSHLKGSGFC